MDSYNPYGGAGMIYFYDTLSTYGIDTTTAVDLRPMVSLKNATYIGGGMGTYSNPFKLEW